MNRVDYIIVGQGIAGSTLALRMMDAGLTFKVIDPCLSVSGSLVAAGLINPITGRKLVKSWMIEDLLLEVELLYSRFEELLNRSFIQLLPIYKLLQSAKDQNDWNVRRLDEDYEKFMSAVHPSKWADVNCDAGFGIIHGGAWLKVDQLILTFRQYLLDNQLLHAEQFAHDDLKITDDNSINYRQLEAKGIVFCEGSYGKTNPYFSGLPLSSAKGEIMIVCCPNLKLDGVLNRHGMVIPLGDDLYKVGATFVWDDDSGEVSQKGIAELKNRFESMVQSDYTIVETFAGFRPISRDRRPMLGSSNDSSRIYLFNGLGTKGVSLAPFFSKHLLDHLEEGNPLLPEVNITRFN